MDRDTLSDAMKNLDVDTISDAEAELITRSLKGKTATEAYRMGMLTTLIWTSGRELTADLLEAAARCVTQREVLDLLLTLPPCKKAKPRDRKTRK